MKFHKQLVVDPGRGDCLRTCYACILDLEVLEVPNFWDEMPDKKDGSEFHKRSYEWLQSRGFSSLRVRSARTNDTSPYFEGCDLDGLHGALCVASIPSQRFYGGSHAVVGQAKTKRNETYGSTYTIIDVIHDPSPVNPPYPWFACISNIEFLIPKCPTIYPSARQAYS